MKYKIILEKFGTGLIVFENEAETREDSVSKAMDEAFTQFPGGKFKLHGIEMTDGHTTVRTEKVSPSKE